MHNMTSITSHSTLRQQPVTLSRRELSVLELMTNGLADREIAVRLDVTPFTVNKHVGQILVKMNCRSRTGAAVKAIRQGICA